MISAEIKFLNGSASRSQVKPLLNQNFLKRTLSQQLHSSLGDKLSQFLISMEIFYVGLIVDISGSQKYKFQNDPKAQFKGQ